MIGVCKPSGFSSLGWLCSLWGAQVKTSTRSTQASPRFTTLIFTDEFVGSDIDTTLWRVADEHEDYWPDMLWRRNHTAENVYIEDGALVIRTQREEEGFSTGAVTTGQHGETPRFDQTYGRFEARVQFPTQQGHWAAFWLWNVTQGTPGDEGRNGSEIDIIEKVWLVDRAQHALDWDGYDEDRGVSHHPVEGLGLDDGGWHTILTDEIGNSGIGPDEWSVGPIDEADLPDYFRIDYVRVWAHSP